jgi:hypothetical protein
MLRFGAPQKRGEKVLHAFYRCPVSEQLRPTTSATKGVAMMKNISTPIIVLFE